MIDWGWWLAFAGTAGVISALVSSTLGAWLSHRAVVRLEGQKRRYLALRLAVILEKYANDCGHAGAEAGNHINSGGHHGSSSWHIPELAEFPNDPEAWLALQPDLANRCLSMANRILDNRGYLREAASHMVEPDESILDEFEPRVMRVGVMAWELASELRARNKIEPYVQEHDTHKWMKERLERLDEEKAKQKFFCVEDM